MSLGIALYSLHRTIQNGDLALTDIPKVCAEKLDLKILDPTYPLMDLADDSNRREFKKAADDAGCDIHMVAVGKCGDLSALEKSDRRAALEQHKPWFERCRELGAFAFRANTGGEGHHLNADFHARCQESFAVLADWAAEHEVQVLIENHGGISANAHAVHSILAAIHSQWLGTVPDFGNVKDDVRYEYLCILMRHAKAVHAKLYDFDAAGKHVQFDLGTCLDIVKAAGYDGPLSIEFEGQIGGEGQPADEVEGVLACKRALGNLGWT